MIFLRNIRPGNFLERMDLNTVTQSPDSMFRELNIYYNILNTDFTAPFILPVEQLNGFCEVPDTYTIQTPLKNVCVYIGEAENTDTVRCKFVWDNRTVLTVDIEKPSLVFLPIQGQTLAYGRNNDKILYIKCLPNFNRRADIMFVDSYGLPQVMSAELGQTNFSDSVQSQFRAYNGEITYDIHKIPLVAITYGDNNISYDLKEFYKGFTDSEVYGLILDKSPVSLIECWVTEASLTAQRFNKLYALSSNLQINTEALKLL